MRSFFFGMFSLLWLVGATGCGTDETSSPPTDAQLSVTPQSIASAAQGDSARLNVNSNTDWHVVIEVDWLTSTPSSGTGDQMIDLTIQPNENSEERSALVTLSAEDIVRSISITQAGISDTDEPLAGDFEVPPNSAGIRDLSSVELVPLLGIGWNLGNSLDAIGGETNWGNPLASQQLMNAVKAAGFDSVRIPVAWSRFSDAEQFTIESGWMDRVEEVVNYALDAELYVVMNIHWDNGWMQPTYQQADYVNNRLAIMWQQIARRFRDYDDRLLFAGTNEVMVEGDYGPPTEEYSTVQNSFNKTFVDTVRHTGGRNAYRHLVIQGFNTNIDHTINFAEIPEDVVEHRLLMEVHYYDPYDFTLNAESNITQWGEIATDEEATDPWANETYLDNEFSRMKTHFVDQGIGVILGEYGVISRNNIADHQRYRIYWNKMVTETAVKYQMAPFYWDNGYDGNNGMALFDRNTGNILYPDLVNALIGALP